MTKRESFIIDSPLGKREPDRRGSPVGVVRMDTAGSYVGIGDLLQEYINNSDQEAWEQIKAKIDYTYENLDLALSPLKAETGFHSEIKSRLKEGQKLLFKPNLVNANNINPQTHGPGTGSTACTEWAFVAALMRWFREKLDVSYHQMALGEAATMTTALAGLFSMINPDRKKITPEAVIEGKSGNFHGGWGFYFVRRYLLESLEPGAGDNPMAGYDESVAGTYIPSGLVSDKLMVYDLNRIFDDKTKGRDIKVPDGVNYKSITLHKAIVGGAKEDSQDLKANQRCILINVPKLKVHSFTLFTNVIKNLGVGLYPMQSVKAGGNRWDYGVPHKLIPGIKGGIPHQVWVPNMDHETGFPKRDDKGNYMVEKTGGITATMIDIIRAIQNQNIFMIHVVDGIESINVDHQGIGLGVKEPEGIVFAGLDPVATDLLCARYMFSNVPLKEALQVDLKDRADGHFPQAVPLPTVEGNNIISKPGYDCPLARDDCFELAEKRGLGNRKYYVIGHDAVTDSPIVSLKGHLGTISNHGFSDLVTNTLFYDTFKFPWDMQQTAFSYLEASDKLAGTSYRQEFLKAYDEDGDGIVTYEDFGKKGIFSVFLHSAGEMISKLGTEKFGYLKGRFIAYAKMLKSSDSSMNSNGHDVMKEFYYGTACSAAYQISQLDIDFPDPFLSCLTCGKGKWPSFQFAQSFQIGVALYGRDYPHDVGLSSLYTSALLYADLTQNGGQYTGQIMSQPNSKAINRYVEKASSGEVRPLDFTLYVPAGYDKLSDKMVPNVEVTDDPAKILTVSFAGGKEIWPEQVI